MSHIILSSALRPGLFRADDRRVLSASEYGDFWILAQVDDSFLVRLYFAVFHIGDIAPVEIVLYKNGVSCSRHFGQLFFCESERKLIPGIFRRSEIPVPRLAPEPHLPAGLQKVRIRLHGEHPFIKLIELLKHSLVLVRIIQRDPVCVLDIGILIYDSIRKTCLQRTRLFRVIGFHMLRQVPDVDEIKVELYITRRVSRYSEALRLRPVPYQRRIFSSFYTFFHPDCERIQGLVDPVDPAQVHTRQRQVRIIRGRSLIRIIALKRSYYGLRDFRCLCFALLCILGYPCFALLCILGRL